MKRTFLIIISVLSCICVGLLASKFQVEALQTWYSSLNKSELSPSESVFTIIWFMLYVCMGLSIGCIVCRKNPKELLFINLFSIQMVLNFLWSVSFFYLQNPLLSFINIILLDIVVIIYLFTAYNKANKFSFAMFIPYSLWLLFETYLNLYICLYN